MRKCKPETTHLRVQAVHGKPFRRAGRVFTDEPTDIPVEELTAEQIHELLGEHHQGLPKAIIDGPNGSTLERQIKILRVEQLNLTPPPPPPPAPVKPAKDEKPPAKDEKPAK
jgi:hypothetical protein